MESSTDPKMLPSPVKMALKWGLITGIVLIIYGMILHFAGMAGSSQGALQWIVYIILAAGIYVGAREHRDKQLGGYMSYGRGLGTGVLVCLFAAIISALSTYLFYTLSPDALEEIKIQAEQELYERGLPQEQEEMSLKFMAKMMTPLGMVLTIIPMYTFVGLIFSLIIAAFVKKNRPLFIDEEEESDVR